MEYRQIDEAQLAQRLRGTLAQRIKCNLSLLDFHAGVYRRKHQLALTPTLQTLDLIQPLRDFRAGRGRLEATVDGGLRDQGPRF